MCLGTVTFGQTTGQDASAVQKSSMGASRGGPIGDIRDFLSPEELKNANGGFPEDWNTLKIPKDLKTPDPMPPLRGDFPGFSREIVQLSWRPWDIIDLYVLKPAGVKNPQAATP